MISMILRGGTFAALAAAFAAGQRPDARPAQTLANGVVVELEEVARTPDVALAMLWTPGASGDDVGREGWAALRARWMASRLNALNREAAEGAQGRVEVFASGVLLTWHGDAASCASVLDAVKGWIEDPAIAADELALARAAARLAADDVGAYYPGAVLRQRAAVGLLGQALGRAPEGRPEALAAMGEDDLVAALRDAGGPRRVAMVGGVGGAARQTLLQRVAHLAAPGIAPGPAAAPPGPRADEPPLAVREGGHGRLAAVYAVLPVVAPPPGTAEYLAFAAAAEVVRLRAWQRLPAASPQATAARLPQVAFAPDLGDRLLFVGRRGGEFEAPAAVRASLAAFAEQLEAFEPSLAEWDDARRALAGRLWGRRPESPQFGGGALGPMLAVRARALALSAHWGWVESDLRGLTEADLSTAFADFCGRVRAPWSLVPGGGTRDAPAPTRPPK